MAFSYPSDYLHYYYKDADSSFLSSKFFNDKQTILSSQLRNLKRRNAKHFKNVSKKTGIPLEELNNLYNYLKTNPSVFSEEMGAFSINENGLRTAGNLDEALGIIKNADEWIDIMNEGARKLGKAAITITDPSNFLTWGKAVIGDYITNAVSTGKLSYGSTEGEAAAQIIRNFRHNIPNNKLFEVPKDIDSKTNSEIQKLDAVQRKVLALIASVNILGGIPGAAKGIFDDSDSESPVLKSWTRQCSGLASGAGGKGHELSTAIAMVRCCEEFFKESGKCDKAISFNGRTIGNDYIKIQPMLTKNSTWENIKKRTKASLSSINSKKSKGDSEVTININEVIISLVRATAKQQLSQYPDSSEFINPSSYLTLHSNASFLNFLNREARMTSTQMQGMIQMLTAHDGSSYGLDMAWEKMKENVAYNGLLSAMAGFSYKEQAQFLAVGDKLISIENILSKMESNFSKKNTFSISAFAEYSPEYIRSDFVSKDIWRGDLDVNSPFKAVSRSNATLAEVSSMLNSTIITIKLDIAKNYISTFLNL